MSTATANATPRQKPRLRERYDSELRAQLKDTLGLGNIMEVPRLEKIVINMGVGRATQQPSLLEGAVRDFLAAHNNEPKPFVWTKTADQILENLRRSCVDANVTRAKRFHRQMLRTSQSPH